MMKNKLFRRQKIDVNWTILRFKRSLGLGVGLLFNFLDLIIVINSYSFFLEERPVLHYVSSISAFVIAYID